MSQVSLAKISIVLATYNEEKNLPDCLESIKDLADEIIIIDGGSIDKTVEIAKRYGAKVVVSDNPPIFHINKQKAIDMATGDWILQLDADERVTPELRDEILKVGNKEVVAYWIPRKNFFLGKWIRYGGMYPDPIIRFFKRDKARLPCKSVHEQMEVDGKTGWLKEHLLHYTAPCFSRYLTNSNRYTTLTAQEYAQKNLPLNPFTTIIYIIVVPISRFLSLYLRHKGFLDGFPGFVFALYSGFHITTSYIKYWEKKKKERLK